MAVDLRFEGLTDFSTGNPAQLRSELQREHAAVLFSLGRAGLLLEPLPTTLLVERDYRANFFDSALTDSTNRNIAIYLPEITRQDEGKYIDVGRVSTAFSVTVIAQAPQLIQGASAWTVAAAVGYQRFRVMRFGWWKQL